MIRSESYWRWRVKMISVFYIIRLDVIHPPIVQRTMEQ